jgi:hypothetical protein
MSELINKNDNRACIRWKLLTGVSALALAAYVSHADVAKAEDASRPPVWLELDGQFAQQKNDLDVYGPDFLSSSPFDASSHLDLEKGRPNIWDKGAAISFQPEGSGWIFSASIRYGKAGQSEGLNHLTSHASIPFGWYNAFQNFRAQSDEGHTIVDFQVGKDVGLGKFGGGGSSVLSAGIRIAQFNSRSHTDIKSQPTNCNAYCGYDRFYESFAAKRGFKGIGPSISWNASANIAGNSTDGAISIDWGVNGAVLFGRQKMSEHHQTKMNSWYYSFIVGSYHHTPAPVSRSKKVTVPNLGGFAGVSWRYADAKITMGYRADMFFGAIDGGIDAAKKENRGFYGPYASISIGIGD